MLGQRALGDLGQRRLLGDDLGQYAAIGSRRIVDGLGSPDGRVGQALRTLRHRLSDGERLERRKDT